MQKPKLASPFDCTGCLACVDICKHDALTSFVDNDGHNYVRINDEACVGCLQCEHVCPVVNKYDYSSNDLRESIPFAAYCKDEGIYMKSTSGGVFAVLARQFIKEGGFVCGVVMQNNHAFHIMTNKMEDVERMQGSKYLQSNTEGVYLKIKSCLKDGHKVLFCGMGCQAAAVCSYFRKNKNRNLLYVVDMICGGVPSQHLVDRFIRSEERWSEVVSFRKKGQYVLTCRNIDGESELLSNSRLLPLYGFFSGLTNRFSCGDCKFAGVERDSDITIGDYWGDNSSIHKSVAIVHSQKGKELLMNCNDLDVFKTDWNFLKFNYRTIVGKTYNNNRWQRRLLPWIFNHLSYKNICGFYGCHFRNPLLFFVYAITKLESMLIRKIIRMKQHKITTSIMKQSDKIDSQNWLMGRVNEIKYNTVVVYLRILFSKILEATPATRYLATAGLRKDPRKFYTDLLIRTHALEKGMSIGKARFGFGKPKAISLLKDLQHYLNIGGDHRFVVESCSVIEKYISYNEAGGADMSEIKKVLRGFLERNNIRTEDEGGLYNLDHSEIRKAAESSFDLFSQSRFSIRDFGTDIIKREKLEDALKLCERTPTACNRQSQRIHIYTERTLIDKLCKMQMGCNGFYEDMQGVILVCGDLNRYSFHELNQVFVDGGLYAMNLMYALHYYDIANIPLTMAHKPHHTNRIKREMNIPDNEQPVLLIGYGSYKNKWKSAQSKRKRWSEYTYWNE